jgi:translocation and assembly module TamB
MRGTFDNPEIEGIAEINNGSIQLEAYPDPVTDIQGRLAFTEGQIKIIQLEGNVSKGSFGAYGTFNYHGLIPDTFSIDVEGENIIVQDVVDSLTLTASPRLRFSGDLKRQKLVGEVLVHNALYTKDLDLQTMVFEKDRKKIVLPTIETSQEKGQIELDLFIKAPKNIEVRNRLAELDLRANLHVQGTIEKPLLEGRVDILRGTILFGNRKYRILSGMLDFTDPSRLNPDMNIQVETVVQEYKISLGIEGNLDQFTLDMSSEPELSKGQITRLLAAGSGTGTNGYDLVTKPIQTLVEGQIEKAVKLDQFTVDVDPLLANSAGNEATPRVTLGKRLFKDLLLTFTTTVGGSEKTQAVEIEYQLSDNISLTARRNETGEIDTSFTFRFKIK